MKTSLILFYIFVFSSSLVLGQSGNQLTPVWEKSYGERLVSSSDDLSYVFSDAQKNLILVGKVERDSSYGDVAVQKISPDGQLIWQFRFSSNKGENYDTPHAALLNDAGELYILGFAAIWQDFTGYGFLLKISSDGQLLWQKDFTTLIPNHSDCQYWHMFLGPTGDIRVAYSVYVTDPSQPFWFFSFAPDGALLEKFSADGFFGQNGEVLYPLFLTNDSDGNFVFQMQGDIFGPMPGSWLRKINTGLDTIIATDQQYFSTIDSNLLKDGFWEEFQAAPDGTIYAVQNNVINNVPQFTVLKLPHDGSPARMFHSGEAVQRQFEDFVVTDSSLIFTGTYRSNSNLPFRVFVMELSEEMNMIREAQWVNSEPNTVPLHIHLPVSGNLYIKTDNLDSGISNLVSVTPQLMPKVEYPLIPASGFHFADISLVEGDNEQISLAGFRYAPIYPQDLLDSKRDFQIFSFNKSTGAPIWEYQFSESGISGVIADQLALDREQNPIVAIRENEGLDFPNSNIYAPLSITLRKYNKDGTLAWIVPTIYHIYNTYTDLENNLLVHVYDGQNNRIIKISPDGVELAQVVLGDYFHTVYVDQQNHYHVQFDNKIVTLDANLSILNQYLVPGKALSIFELPGDSSIYVYSDSVREDYVNVDFYLFKNGVQQWVKEVVFENNYQSGIIDVKLNPNNGSFYISSTGIAGNPPHYLHRITLDGGYQSVLLNGTGDQQTLEILPTGQVWVFGKTEATLFSPELEEIKTVVALGGGAIVRNGYLFKLEPEKVTIFDGQGNILIQLSDTRFQEVTIDSDFNLYAVYTFGNYVFSFLQFYWARGALAKFNLRDYVNFTVGTGEPGQSAQTSGKPLIWCNNPVADHLNVHLVAAGQAPERLLLFDANGTQMNEFAWPGEEGETSVPMVGLPPGFYFASIAGKEGVIATLKVVKVK